MSDDRDVIFFPAAETIPQFAIAFLGMMFAHAKFEAQVHALETMITMTPAKRPHFLARLLRRFTRKRRGGLGDARARPKHIKTLIEDRPGLAKDQETSQIIQILRAAIDPCDQRNLLVHGRWSHFDPKTSTIKVRGNRRREWGEYTEGRISTLAETFKTLEADLYTVRSAIEQRRGDHDVDLPA
jgi:hypothetical protein